MKIWMLIVMLLAVGPGATADAQDSVDRFIAKVEKDALRNLDHGKPAKQLTAARTLGADHAERIAPVLARLLADRDPAIRLAAADLLWSLAAIKPAAFAAAKPALQAAIDDPDPAIAMNAAGALTSMGAPASETAAARRRVLQQGRAPGYVQFLAARGLVGVDPGLPLAPFLLAYLFDAAEARGGSSNNREIAVRALNDLVATRDRGLIDPLKARLGTAHPATKYLLKAIHGFDPRPEGWTEVLIAHTRSPNDEIADTAWDLLADQRDTASIARWAPLAAALLRDPKGRSTALSALSRVAGQSSVGLAELADFGADASIEEAQRIRAIDILGDAAEVTDVDYNKQVAGAARTQWLRVCTPVLTHERASKRTSACIAHLSYIHPQDRDKAPLLIGWLARNEDADAKLMYLERIEAWGIEGIGATDAVKRELGHADPRVVKAAETALDRIRPAWRESAARQQRLAAAPPAAKASPLESASGRRGADGAALFEAVRAGDLARVKKLVHAGNIHGPVHYPQIQGATPVPLGVAINYCGIPTLSAAKLAAIVEYLISLGADPDASDPHGENLFDRAKAVCPPEVIQALSR